MAHCSNETVNAMFLYVSLLIWTQQIQNDQKRRRVNDAGMGPQKSRSEVAFLDQLVVSATGAGWEDGGGWLDTVGAGFFSSFRCIPS